VQEAERVLNAATSESASAAKEVGRCERGLAKATAEARALEEELSAAIGPKLARDPVPVIDERIARLQELDEQEILAADAWSAARETVTVSERERDRLAAGVAESRARLESVVVGGLLDRARAVAGPAAAIPELGPRRRRRGLAGRGGAARARGSASWRSA
jgi:phage shock protein A